MVKRFLITTADERTWRTDCPVLFLGEWCRPYNQCAKWKGADVEVVPYHWDDRGKLYRDYGYLQEVYEDVLVGASEVLNNYHGVRHSVRYWRILVGPWLYPFINVAFDRWTMVERATENYEIDGTYILDYPDSSMVPADLRGFSPQNVQWNHYLYGRIIRYQKRIPWTLVRLDSERDREHAQVTNPGSPVRQGFARQFLASVVATLNKLMPTRPTESLVVGSYLPRLEEIKLQLALGQMPKAWSTPRLRADAPSVSQRRLRIPDDGKDGFKEFICTVVFEQMPVAYLEGYAGIVEKAAALPWPSRPKLIFTSNNYNFDEIFKAWAALKVERGAPLIIGQHGGHMGSARKSAGEDHQIKVADRFLTWGWQDDRPSTYPSLAFPSVGRPRIRMNDRGGIVLVTTIFGLFSYKLSSVPIGPNQSESSFEDQMNFTAALTDRIRNNLTVRIDKSLDDRLGTFHVSRWMKQFPDINIDFSNKPFERTIRQYRLFVYSYNSTGFLEALERNLPTIIFWDPALFELRAAAQPYFDRLKEVGIFHETPESAATKVIEVWEDVATWWNRSEIQDTRHYFCGQFARMPKQPIWTLKEALTSVKPAWQERASDTRWSGNGHQKKST